MKTIFRKRYYHNIIDPIRDIGFIIGKLPLMVKNRKAGWISSGFQERLMMAVTAVNGCRYCSYYHTRVALRMGFEPELVRSLLSGDIENPDPDEVRALLYAQHWAETNANPDNDLRQEMVDYYGSERAQVIETILRMIRFGNLSGNSLDYIIYKLTGGRRGN